MDPINTAPLISKVAEQGALAAFMLLVIIALSAACVYLYRDSRAERKENTQALGTINTTMAGLKEVINVIAHKN